jgi:hypothetical protein
MREAASVKARGAIRVFVGVIVFVLIVAGVGVALSNVSRDIGRARAAAAGRTVGASPVQHGRVSAPVTRRTEDGG